MVSPILDLALLGAISDAFAAAQILQFLDFPTIGAGGHQQIVLIEETPILLPFLIFDDD